MALDAAELDPKHYKVAFENDRVRVLRITYGPHEKSVMHEHPKAVAVFLTDAKVRFELPDGTTQEAGGKAGDVMWYDATTHNPENIGEAPFKVVEIELKG